MAWQASEFSSSDFLIPEFGMDSARISRAGFGVPPKRTTGKLQAFLDTLLL
jgi:hypothetical protein